MKGCKCVTGCNTRCSCRRNDRQCSEGCERINCTNISVNTSENSEVAEIALEEVATTNGMEDEETDELMDWIFGSGQVEETMSGHIYRLEKAQAWVWRLLSRDKTVADQTEASSQARVRLGRLESVGELRLLVLLR